MGRKGYMSKSRKGVDESHSKNDSNLKAKYQAMDKTLVVKAFDKK
jgi:hypothetical protein